MKTITMNKDDESLIRTKALGLAQKIEPIGLRYHETKIKQNETGSDSVVVVFYPPHYKTGYSPNHPKTTVFEASVFDVEKIKVVNRF